MQDEKQILIELKNDSFTGSPNAAHGQTHDRFNRRIDRTQDERTVQLQALKPLTDEALLQCFDVNDDVGKLGQGADAYAARRAGAGRAIRGRQG